MSSHTMASSVESVNDSLKPNKVLFGVNSSGRILRLDADSKTYSNSRGSGGQMAQGWKVGNGYLIVHLLLV